MHVGYVLKKFPRASETFVLNEILALEAQGVEVTVFSLNRPDDGVFHRGLADLRRPVVYLPARKPDGWLQVLRDRSAWLVAKAPHLFAHLQALLASGRPDVWNVLGWCIDLAHLAEQSGLDHLHAHFATVAAHVAGGVGALTGLPFSVTCHAKDIYRQGIVADQFRALLAPAAFVVTVCEANRRWIESELAGGPHLRIEVLYNGVDTERFHPRNRRVSERPFLLAVGRLVEKKGFHLLLDALATLAARGLAPRCVVVGDGEERERLQRRRDALGLEHVQFVGMRTQDEVLELLRATRAMVLPCIIGDDGNRDALPTVLLEAQAAGVPVVSSGVGGVDEILDGGAAGVLVPAGEIPPLAKAIELLWRDDELCAVLAERGRARAERLFDLRTNSRRLAGLIDAARAEQRCGEVSP